MNTWTDTERPGYRTKTIKRGNVTIVINRPILPDKERVKRESLVELSLSNYGKSLSQSQPIIHN